MLEVAEFYSPTPNAALTIFGPFPPMGMLCLQLHLGASGSQG